MDPEDADAPLEARPPLLGDLVSLCRDLNREGACYVVIGGMAVIQAGFVRATNGVDLLIDTSPENQERVRRALMALPEPRRRRLDPGRQHRPRLPHVRVWRRDQRQLGLGRQGCLGVEAPPHSKATRDTAWRGRTNLTLALPSVTATSKGGSSVASRAAD